MLSDRRQRVLAALIEEYVSHALPVGSRTIVEQYHLGVSSATVRNELSVLEEAGYIAQPHTSAGRIPTEVGYRSFVDDLLKTEIGTGELDDAMLDSVNELRQSAGELDDLLEKTSEAMANFTECLSIVVPPSTLSLHIRQLSLVSLSDTRVLIVLVCDDGQVLNRSVDFNVEVDCDELAGVQNLLNDVFVGKSFKQIRTQMDLKTVTALQGPLASVILGEVFACLQQGDTGRAHRLGLASLLQQPEFARSSALLPVLNILDDDAVLLQLLDESSTSDVPMVRIGSENEIHDMEGVSVVAAQYGRGDAAGMVAVIGPTRMDYAQVIRAVRAARSALEDTE